MYMYMYVVCRVPSSCWKSVPSMYGCPLFALLFWYAGISTCKYAVLNSNVWVHATCIHPSAVYVFLYLYAHTTHSLLVVKPIILTIFPPIAGLVTCSYTSVHLHCGSQGNKRGFVP